MASISQPLTAKQIARRTGIDVDTCSYVLGKCAVRRFVTCLNPNARSSRLYWVTRLGQGCRKKLLRESAPHDTPQPYELPEVDWELYGWACFRHRGAVIKTLTRPMQPSEIKRILRVHGPRVRISANNIRDVMRLFLQRGIVQKVFVRKKAHPRYELTELGQRMQRLLSRAEAPL